MSRPPVTRVALYARVSTNGHGQDVGLQLEELRTAAVQRGWTSTEFVDEGISGSTTKRPGLDALLKQAHAGKFEVVMIWKLDRLARSVIDLLQITETLRSAGVGLCSLRDPNIDTTTPTGRFALSILGSVAELERELIRERVIAGVRRSQAKGTHCGRPRVAVDLRPALAMFGQGHGIKEVAKALRIPVTTLRRRLVDAGEWPRPQADATAASPASPGCPTGQPPPTIPA